MTDGTDVIDLLAGIAAGSPLDAVRRARPEARRHAQASFDGLFAPLDATGFTVPERWAVAAFVAALHDRAETRRFYTHGLLDRDAALGEAILAEAARAAAAAPRGPAGRYPPGPLSREDSAAPGFRADPADIGARLAAALDHVHMLLFHPRDAAPAHLQRLVDAGWTTPAIVTLSQLVAFLSFQIRVVAGLRAMAEAA